MPALLLIFLVAMFSDQSLACSMDMDWVREHDINLAGLQADCSTYETRNYRFMEGFLLTSPVVLACSFLGLVSFRLVSAFIRKKPEQRSIRALIRISSIRLFDLIWLSSFVTVWFFAIGLAYMMNGPALTYSAIFTLLGLPVVRVTLAFAEGYCEPTFSRILNFVGAMFFPILMFGVWIKMRLFQELDS